MGFETYHPAINLLYFAGTIAAAILFRQPVYLAISYVCAFAYSVHRGGRRALLFDLCLVPPLITEVLTFMREASSRSVGSFSPACSSPDRIISSTCLTNRSVRDGDTSSRNAIHTLLFLFVI